MTYPLAKRADIDRFVCRALTRLRFLGLRPYAEWRCSLPGCSYHGVKTRKATERGKERSRQRSNRVKANDRRMSDNSQDDGYSRCVVNRTFSVEWKASSATFSPPLRQMCHAVPKTDTFPFFISKGLSYYIPLQFHSAHQDVQKRTRLMCRPEVSCSLPSPHVVQP